MDEFLKKAVELEKSKILYVQNRTEESFVKRLFTTSILPHFRNVLDKTGSVNGLVVMSPANKYLYEKRRIKFGYFRTIDFSFSIIPSLSDGFPDDVVRFIHDGEVVDFKLKFADDMGVL